MRRGNGWSYVLAAGLATALTACGGGGGGGGGVTTASTPPPTPPPPVVVAQVQGFALEAGFTGRLPFTTSRAGAIEATVDWTYATNDVDVALVKGDCTFDQFEAGQCQILSFAISVSTKPEKVRTDGAAAGAYTLFVENTGPGDESVSLQVVLTPSATGSAGPVTAAAVGAGWPGFKAPARGRAELR